MENLNQQSIDNLTSLWLAAGIAFGNYQQHTAFDSIQVPGSEWPNRIWLKSAISPEVLSDAADFSRNNQLPLTLSHWGDFENSLQPLFEAAGFEAKSTQIGMSLKLSTPFEHPGRISLETVTTSEQAKIWAELYPQSFGYTISAEILEKANHTVQFYLVRKEEQAIGTAMILESNGVVGIHGVGIIPDFRKQGFAEEVMAVLLNNAIAKNIKLATLQSSAMGKNIYQKLGFTADFLMTNYRLKI
ncbi:acetyltransferase (GNAT) family protein [Chitinophaga dinghuensis]|uniref:Acetyltransferase (GNAT) family protein n=1 Tax=Chitinophaga dinghuensis TaxID=1539050 RepID=A0A327W1U0_9BACT|nr:GNAT family N-acetyltransferase [Chitinophaga dinghuensis]RAJ83199.1 acetyltransferase (GNAT) family protein [Chitinophaga dinghuensis]